MPIDILVGLQYGSEGKGKISAYLAGEYDVSVRVGGWQSGHTLEHKGKIYKMKQLPCQWTNPHIKIVIGAGALINLKVLNDEIDLLEKEGYEIRNRLYIDKRAIVTNNGEGFSNIEKNHRMFEKIGSTQEGVGEALIRKIQRNNDIFQANKCSELKDCVVDTIQMINECNLKGLNVFIESSQGSHLSIVTSNHYPYCTSMDCNVSGTLSSCGLSPFDVRDVIGVMRTYPIRVAGNSGNTGEKEITWNEITKRSGSKTHITEYTTVTNRIRRVFEFSNEDVLQSIMINKPNIIALNFIDYIDALDCDIRFFSELSRETAKYILRKEQDLDVSIRLIGTGQSNKSIIKLW